MKTLHTRQYKLYKYLKKNAVGKLCAVHKRNILIDLKEYYCPGTTDEHIQSMNIYNDTSYRILTDDIQALNQAEVIKRVIISDSYNGIYLATEEDYETALKRELASNLSRLKKTYKKIQNTKLNGQYTLFGDTLKSLSDDLVM